MDLESFNKIVQPIKIYSIRTSSQTDRIIEFMKSVKKR